METLDEDLNIKLLRNEISAVYALMVSKLSWGFYPADGYSNRKVAGFYVQYVCN